MAVEFLDGYMTFSQVRNLPKIYSKVDGSIDVMEVKLPMRTGSTKEMPSAEDGCLRLSHK